MFVLIAYAQKPPLNAHADLSSVCVCGGGGGGGGARGLKFDQSIHLYPYFVHVSSECSGESAHYERASLTCATRQYDKYKIPNSHVLANNI